MISEAMIHDPGDHQGLRPWQEALEDNVRTVGDAVGSWGDMLAKTVKVSLVEGDDRYMPLPAYKYCEDGLIEIACNTDVFEYWQGLFVDTPDMTPRKVQNLYLASAAASVELAHLGMTAKSERKYDTGTGMRNAAIERAQELISKFQDKKELIRSAGVLEAECGVVGAVNAVNKLQGADVIDVNKARYSIGVAMFALGYDGQQTQEVVNTFRSNLVTELRKYEETLLDFLANLDTPGSYAKIQSNMETVQSYSFPRFLFAGTIPMGYRTLQ